MELLLLGIFAAALLLCVFSGISIIYAMILGLVLFFAYGLVKKKMETDACFFMAGSENSKEYPADIFADRNDDCCMEGKRLDCIYCLLCIWNMRTINYAAGFISFMFAGVFPDRNCIWYSGYYGGDLHDHGKEYECF